MIWGVLGGVVALVMAVIGWALPARGGQLDDAEGRGDEEPSWCPMCGGPCYDDAAGYSDEWRLP